MARSQGKPMNMGRPLAAPAEVDPSEQALEALRNSAGIVRTQLGFQQAITVQKERDLDKVRGRVLHEAARMGEDFVYAWRQKSKESREPDGKVLIEGLSIDGAMILSRNWGNCVTIPELVQETQSHYLIQASFVDLEAGSTTIRLYRQRKNAAAGDYDVDRKEDIAFQIGQSKAIRNAIDKALPSWLRDEAIEAAKSNAAKKYDPPEKHIPAVIEYAEGLGVTQAQLIARVGKPFIGWTPYDIVILRATFKAIARRETSVHSEFGELAEAEAAAAAAEADPTHAPAPPAAAPPPADVASTPTAPPLELYNPAGMRIGFPIPVINLTLTEAVAALNAWAAGAMVYEAIGTHSITAHPPRPAAPPKAPAPTADQLEAEAAERALGAREAAAAAKTEPSGPAFVPPKGHGR